ncbi:MAG: glycosyl hydrolase [Candidatus Methylacidiphilales bacterium]|nr:glycosyl hydrolase [Candidatus Methylacidiphilales bacterium]
MKKNLALGLSVFALGTALLCWCLQPVSSPLTPADPPQHPPKGASLLSPTSGVYSGAYLDWGEKEDAVTLEGIEYFEKMVGKKLAIVASSSYWGEQTFPARNLRIIRNTGAVPLVYWSPWDRPYDQNHPPDRFSLTRIISGEHDAYIDRWADEAARFNTPLFVCFGLEMNGTWFPWSGCHYGGGKITPGGKVYEGPQTFIKAYRHVVDRVRSRGAGNILWVFHANDYSYPNEDWNNMASYYPGREYVDWLGLSVYGKQFKDDKWCDFEPLLRWSYADLCALDPSKPVMLAEWGVGEFPRSGSKAAFIEEALRRIPSYPRIRAAVFWHERWQNSDGSYSNLRADSSRDSLEAFRKGMASPAWLDRPQWTSRLTPTRSTPP